MSFWPWPPASESRLPAPATNVRMFPIKTTVGSGQTASTPRASFPLGADAVGTCIVLISSTLFSAGIMNRTVHKAKPLRTHNDRHGGAS